MTDPKTTKELLKECFFDTKIGENIYQRDFDMHKLEKTLTEIVERIDALYAVVVP